MLRRNSASRAVAGRTGTGGLRGGSGARAVRDRPTVDRRRQGRQQN
ncbi:hypothetical protein BN2537_15111 [Streptomyces venezuelae]|nr:hypothetical protein BN2537_15111 [Streptomyces venezuelae]